MVAKPRKKPLPARLNLLSQSQRDVIVRIVDQFERPFDFSRNELSDIVSECVLREFGDILRIHHCFSSEPFTKDKFEHALQKAFVTCGVEASLARRGNAGHDITINGIAYSLKTQADASIKASTVHISKFMELGQGKWGDDANDLAGLRERFFYHMESYDRILTLRRLTHSSLHFYELVEIPKTLLLQAGSGKLEMMQHSKQSPKPGYCTVTDAADNVKFQLYFDGGTERKLQIKRIDKALCVVHATWKFDNEAKISETKVLAS
jgi:hypothetical protein